MSTDENAKLWFELSEGSISAASRTIKEMFDRAAYRKYNMSDKNMDTNDFTPGAMQRTADEPINKHHQLYSEIVAIGTVLNHAELIFQKITGENLSPEGAPCTEKVGSITLEWVLNQGPDEIAQQCKAIHVRLDAISNVIFGES